MGGLFGKLFGTGGGTDRNNQLSSWGSLTNLGNWEKKFGKGQQTEGAGNLSTAADFFKTLLSGDRSKIGTILAPEIGTIQNQASQNLNTLSQFGNRSGGTNAAVNASTSTGSAEIQKLISTLLGQSGQELGALGSTQEGLGLSAADIAGKLFSTVAGQATSDRSLFGGPLAQAQSSELLSGILSLGKMLWPKGGSSASTSPGAGEA